MPYWTATDEQQSIIDSFADKLHALDDFILCHTDKQNLKAEHLFCNYGESELLAEYAVRSVKDQFDPVFEEIMRVRFFERHLSKNAGEAVAIAFSTALQHSDTSKKLKAELKNTIRLAKDERAYERKKAKIFKHPVPGVVLLLKLGASFSFKFDLSNASEIVIRNLRSVSGGKYEEKSLHKGADIEKLISFDLDRVDALIEKLAFLHDGSERDRTAA